MRVADSTAENYENLDAELRRTVRLLCSLQKRASAEYIAALRAEGGLGYTELCDIRAACTVAQACRALSLPKSPVAQIACKSLIHLTGSSSLPAALEYVQDPTSQYRSSRSKFACRSRWSTLNRAIRPLRSTISLELREAGGLVECWAGHKNSVPEKI